MDSPAPVQVARHVGVVARVASVGTLLGVLVVLGVTGLIGCHAASVSDAPAVSAARRAGDLEDDALTEASGATVGATGVIWSLNDSGNEPLLFALDSTGAARGRVRVEGTKNSDWEAVSAGPCPQGACLYIGDVGDNGAQRVFVTIYRVREPAATDTTTEGAAALRVAFADGPRDVEAMWVAPDTAVWLVTKRPMSRPDGSARPSQLYRVPASAWGSERPVRVVVTDSIPHTPAKGVSDSWVTDAALSPPDASGRRRIAIRTYADVMIFDATPAFGTGALVARCSLVPLYEEQGESLTWLPSGRLLLLSEGRRAPVHTAQCP
jgi:hypothetical protein